MLKSCANVIREREDLGRGFYGVWRFNLVQDAAHAGTTHNLGQVENVSSLTELK